MVVLVTTGLAGCGGPSLDDPDLGKVIYQLPDLPGADKSVPLPQLEDNQPAAADHSDARG